MSKQRFVLVVEDEPVVRLAFETAFSGQDEFMLDTAATVRDALEKLAQCQYDLVILDINLEGQRFAGMQIMREMNRLTIRARSRGQRVLETAIVTMSGSVPFDEFLAEANELECLTFIKKPIQFDTDYVRRVMNKIGVPLLPKPLTEPPLGGRLPA